MKVAFIYNFKKSDWKSCEVISSNLLKSYKEFLDEKSCKSFCFSADLKKFEILDLAKKIFDERPSHIVIIDHKPHPKELLKFLSDLYKNKKEKKPEIIIHIFGDFTLYSGEWAESASFLKNFNVKFVTASDRQRDLVSKFLKNNDKILYKCPFPVDEKSFLFDQKKRDELRKKLGISNDQVVFLYTGRMSLQKKILELTLDFAQFLKITKSDAFLFFAGDYDDIGNPYIGTNTRHGEFCQKHVALLKGVPLDVRNRIKYLGNYNSKNLESLYSASDYFVSLSVHNDEDYGMSPAEAICTGLPAILSNWAGYASFDLKGENGCRLIPVKIESGVGLKYNSKILIKELVFAMNCIIQHREKRKAYSNLNHKAFGIKSNSEVLKKMLKAGGVDFKGFSDLANRFARAFLNNKPPFAIYKYEINYTELYLEAYESYLSKEF